VADVNPIVIASLNHVLAMSRKLKDPFHKYLPVMVNNTHCAALLDSGTLFRCCISKDFLAHLGIPVSVLRPIAITSVGSAKEGVCMKVLGEVPTKLKLQLGGHSCVFPFKPVVLEGLFMPLNISGPFLAEFGINQIHSDKSIRVKGTMIKLLASPDDNHKKTGQSRVYTMKDEIVPPHTQVHFSAHVAAIDGRTMAIGDGLLQGSELFEANTNCSSWRHSLVRPQKNGCIPVGAYNTTGEAILIPANTLYGTFSLTRHHNDMTNLDCVAIIDPEQRSGEPKEPDPPPSPLGPWAEGKTTRANYKQRA
jgi:hypothetical protein